MFSERFSLSFSFLFVPIEAINEQSIYYVSYLYWSKGVNECVVLLLSVCVCVCVPPGTTLWLSGKCHLPATLSSLAHRLTVHWGTEKAEKAAINAE